MDVDVKNGAQLLDRLIKEIVTESDSFDVHKFIPLLRRKLKTRNPYIRSLLVGWITVLDSVPFINMLDFLPHFLEGLFNMLSDDIREIRQQADQALCDFLQEIKDADVTNLQLGEIINILVRQCNADQVRFNRLTAIQWIHDLIHLGRERLKELYAKMLDAVLLLLADQEGEIRGVAKTTNAKLLELVQHTGDRLDFGPLLLKLQSELSNKDETTRLASLSWISMLLGKDAPQVLGHINDLFPLLVDKLLCDPADAVVLKDLEVLARIACNEPQFLRVLTDITRLFRVDRGLLETRGSMIIRNLCLQLDCEKIYLTFSHILGQQEDLEFASVMIQTLNHILLTAEELLELRLLLQRSFDQQAAHPDTKSPAYTVFKALYASWCHNPVATFALCLLTQAYRLSSALVIKFADVDITLGFLIQIDKLVQLIESPIFVRLRLQLLEPQAPLHSRLVKSLFGLLMLLPQSAAFKTLRDRLMSVSALYLANPSMHSRADEKHPVYVSELLDQFTSVTQMHTQARVEALRNKRLSAIAIMPTMPASSNATISAAPTLKGPAKTQEE